jgi:hypothetical protein
LFSTLLGCHDDRVNVFDASEQGLAYWKHHIRELICSVGGGAWWGIFIDSHSSVPQMPRFMDVQVLYIAVYICREPTHILLQVISWIFTVYGAV